jgi:hypothetical protein
MAAILLKHSSAKSRSPASVRLSAVTNSAITDLNCRGESSGSLLASRMAFMLRLFRDATVCCLKDVRVS